MKKIEIIVPVNNEAILSQADLSCITCATGIELTLRYAKNNLQEICSAEDEKIVIPSIIEAAINAENQGADGIIVNCFGEPGVDQADNRISTPIIGIASPAMRIATNNGTSFLIISSVDAHNSLIDLLAERFGVGDKMFAAKAVNISPAMLTENPKALIHAAMNIIKIAYFSQGVTKFILGCGAMKFKSTEIEIMTKDKLGINVSVFDPLLTAINYMSSKILSA